MKRGTVNSLMMLVGFLMLLWGAVSNLGALRRADIGHNQRMAEGREKMLALSQEQIGYLNQIITSQTSTIADQTELIRLMKLRLGEP